ncbi:hypothetical protein CerSpe_290800 [Prunus speciosa]
MKRKTSEPNPEDPLQIRIPSHRGFHGIRSSDSRFPVTTTPRTAGRSQNPSTSRLISFEYVEILILSASKLNLNAPVKKFHLLVDISCKERVKFTNLDNEDQRPPRCEFADNAKTSEYAFFKKLKEGASHKAHSYSLHKEAYQSNNSKSRNCSREKVNMVQNKRVDVRSSFLNENATPEPNMERACATLEGVHRKQNDMVEEYENSLRNKGKRFTHFEETETENRHADVFYRKRQKLRQWVAETSFPEIDELCSKGYDFVSVLLSRLVPKCNENNKLKDPKLTQAETNSKAMPIPSYKSDIDFKELPWTPTRNFMELDCGPCLHDMMPSCWSKRSRESIFCSGSPTSYVYKNHLQYRVWEPESELLGGNAISCTESDSQSVLRFKEYGLVTSGHVKEMDAFCQPNEYLIKRELSVPMLGWDFGSTKEDRNSSDLSRYGAEHRSASLASYQNHEVLRHCLEGNDDIRSGFPQIPLTLSCITNFINPTEDCIEDTACEVGSTIFSVQNDHWFRSNIIHEGHYLPHTESLLPFGGSWREYYSSTFHALQFPEQEDLSSRLLTYDHNKYGRILDDSSQARSLAHFVEDNVSIHESSAFCPQEVPLDTEKAWPCLLDNSSWDRSKREVNFDDSDVDIFLQ